MMSRLAALAIVLASSLNAQQDTTGVRVVIHVDSLDRATFSNIAELLQARVPGLTITRDGDGRVHWYMRGQGSVSGSAPLVLVDDVRVAVVGPPMPQFAGHPSALDDIDIEDVERVEVPERRSSARPRGCRRNAMYHFPVSPPVGFVGR